MNIKQLEVLRTLLATGSTIATAKTMGLSQSGVSRLLQQLEADLSMSLFVRDKGRLVPTPEALLLARDAENILLGPPDAATQYFRRTTQTNLYERFLPIVKKATGATGVTSNYKKVLEAANKNKYVGEILGAVTDPQSLDLDSYVTSEALDRLFKRIAEEEKRIRADPVARTSDLLRNVFGALSK
jgi:hypothetical protein